MTGGPAVETDPAADLSVLLAEFLLLVPAAEPKNATRRAPSVSAWSVAQHLDHLIRAATLNLRAIQAIERGRDDPEAPPLTHVAREILETGRIPRRAAQAPETVIPRDVEALAAVLDELAPALQQEIDEWGSLEHRVASLPPLPGRIPHPLLGALGAAEWLRFARVHTHHHRVIIEEILAAE